jgi:ferredoxin
MAAIDPGKGKVDWDRCILCLGCINYCPSNAVTMKCLGKEIYDTEEFVKRNGLISGISPFEYGLPGRQNRVHAANRRRMGRVLHHVRILLRLHFYLLHHIDEPVSASRLSVSVART